MNGSILKCGPGTAGRAALLSLALLFGQDAFPNTLDHGGARYDVELDEAGMLSALRMQPSAPLQGVAFTATAQAVLDREQIVTAALQFIDDNPDLFQVGSGGLHLLEAEQITGTWDVEFLQIHQEFPVYGSSVTLELSPDGQVIGASTRGVIPESEVVDTDFVIAKRQAVELALQACDGLDDCEPAPNPLHSGYPAIYVHPEGDRAMAWVLELMTHGFILDANTGVVIDEDRSWRTFNVGGMVRGRRTPWGGVPTNPTTRVRLENLTVRPIGTAGIVPIHIPVVVDFDNGTEPVLSGDGGRAVYVSDQDGDRDIYRADFDGGNVLKLTFNSVDDDQPAVSDDGALVVFVSEVAGERQIFRVNADGTGLARVTATGTGDNHSPALSDDGFLLAFVSGRDGDSEIYTINSDGANEVRVTDQPGEDVQPSIDGAGRYVAFSSERNGNGFEVFVADLSSGAIEQVTFNTADAGSPSISDDGIGIALQSDQDGDADIFYAEATAIEGWTLWQRTLNQHEDLDPDLSGDGGHIGFASDRRGDFDIYLLPVEGDVPDARTRGLPDERRPSLSDDAARMVYAEDDFTRFFLMAADLLVAGGETPVYTQIDPGFLSIVPLDTSVDAPGGEYLSQCPVGAWIDLEARLSGKHVSVFNQAGPDLAFDLSICPPFQLDLEFNRAGGPDTDTAQVNAYYVVDAGYRYLEKIYTRNGIGMRMVHIPVHVNRNDLICNAAFFPKPDHMRFYLADPMCVNSTIDTVILHEYGHYLDYSWHQWGAFGKLYEDALAEGIADMNALFATGFVANPSIGVVLRGLHPGGAFDRNYKPNGNWYQRQLVETGFLGPNDFYEVGGAFAGFAWSSRGRLKDAMGDPGIRLAEDLFYTSLTKQQVEIRANAVQVFLQLGGGDGIFHNEKPQYEILRKAACEHGLDAAIPPDVLEKQTEVSFDHGDAPPPYPTRDNNPARHGTIRCEQLGATVSLETGAEDLNFDTDNRPNLDPLDTDRDDGVTFPEPFLPGAISRVRVSLSVDPDLLGTRRYDGTDPYRRLYLNGWFDWNGNGEWTVGERMIGVDSSGTGVGVFDPNSDDPVTGFDGQASMETDISVDVPAGLTDKPFAVRFRLDMGENAGLTRSPVSHRSLAGVNGIARYGEVEDYLLCVDLRDSPDKGRVRADAAAGLAAHWGLLDNALGAMAQLFSNQVRHVFFGHSATQADAHAVLLLDEGAKTYRLISEDGLLGAFDSGLRNVPSMRVLAGSPSRVILSDSLLLGGHRYLVRVTAILLPSNRVVVDLVDQSTRKRIRYQLGDCAGALGALAAP